MQNTVEYWLDLCDYDLDTAWAMQKTERYLYVGFMCHQVAEKGFKAIVANKTTQIPPKTHDLRKLAKLGGVFDMLTDEQFEIIDKVSPLQIDARYPEYKEKISQTLSKEYCEKMIEETEVLLCWIKEQLGK